MNKIKAIAAGSYVTNIDLEQINEFQSKESDAHCSMINEQWHMMCNKYKSNLQSAVARHISDILHCTHGYEIAKVCFMMVVIVTIKRDGCNFTCRLKDNTGTVCGLIHRDVLHETTDPQQFRGAILVLKNCSILGGLKKVHVNITESNVHEIVPSKM